MSLGPDLLHPKLDRLYVMRFRPCGCLRVPYAITEYEPGARLTLRGEGYVKILPLRDSVMVPDFCEAHRPADFRWRGARCFPGGGDRPNESIINLPEEDE